nr:carbamoyl phosphate synthase small subunit [Synergistales bacterium]
MGNILLTLSDSTRWEGFTDRPDIDMEGEVVFTTANTGYPQAISDPSFHGQILVFAFPPIGIYGIDPDNLEGSRPWVSGVIIHQRERTPLKEVTQLEEWLNEWAVPLIYQMDCRNLVLHLREKGTLMGRLSEHGAAPQLACLPPSLIRDVSVTQVEYIGEKGKKVGIFDCGTKRNIIRELLQRNCRIVIFPHDTPADRILEEKLEGLILSNGPGNPADLEMETATIRALLGQIPLFGICLGTQLLAQACGGRTEKLPYGHRGANQPVLHLPTGKGYVTSQNHGYAIVEGSL